MDTLDILRQFPTEDEDLKVVQMLGLRVFNAFASSLKLALSGYSQNSALIMRDILETVFLVDLFRTDRSAIERWRLAKNKERWKNFKPVTVRDLLDKRDGATTGRRKTIYDMFCELAGHPTMEGVAMLRPQGMDARNGPFIDPTALEAVLSEMGRLAIQVGEIFNAFLPDEWPQGQVTKAAFFLSRQRWIAKCYT